MQKIEAVIQPSKLDAVKDALVETGVAGDDDLPRRADMGGRRGTRSFIADESTRWTCCRR